LIKRAWQKMLSGRRLDVINPSPLDVEIEDIAHGLAFQARWNGQTKGDFVFSVANHSILVWVIFLLENPKIEKKWQLVSLLHDAPEYVIGDMISPVKKEVGRSYIDLETKLQEAIHIRFGLPALIPDKIKKKIKISDRKAAWIEATTIAGFSKREANKIFLKPDEKIIKEIKIVLKDPLKTREEFLSIYKILVS
tara:strand:+ start:526 stop:1107 length:582 start_codon:yes stop_codon:yes gene_type:complete